MKIKPTLYLISASLFGAFFILITIQIILFVIGDISAGVLVRKPETGWGILISTIFLAPLAGLSFLFFILCAKNFRKITQKPLWQVALASSITAVILVSGYWVYHKISSPEYSRVDDNAVSNLASANKTVYAAYTREGKLPSSINGNVGYRAIGENKYELCSEFAVDTTPYKYDERYLGKEGIVDKVKNKAVFKSNEVNRYFFIHEKGVQCYQIAFVDSNPEL